MLAEDAGMEEAVVIGGSRLYAEAIPLVDEMRITRIDKVVDVDAFFPYFDTEEFERFCVALGSDYRIDAWVRRK